MPSVLFISNHCYLDFVSGAALSMRDLLASLTQRGWEAHVFCGSMLDTRTITLEQILGSYKSEVRIQHHMGSPAYQIHELNDAGVCIRIYHPTRWSTPMALAEGYPFLKLLDEKLRDRRPDIIITFGGGWFERGVLAIARRHGVPAVFWLRNTEYNAADLFKMVVGAIVPSQFSADYYQKKLQLKCHVIPSLILPGRVLCASLEPRYVTFVTPLPSKGIFYFARIASELGRLRPDIPILIATGRGETSWLGKTGLNLRGLPNLKILPPTNNPRDFLRMTRLLVVPVLWQETFLRTAAEAMLNGIPTLASRRGGVAETLGASGFLFDIAPHHTPRARLIPTVREVAPWIQTIARIFDNPRLEAQEHEKCLREAARFDAERTITAHEQYLSQIARDHHRSPSIPSSSLAADLKFLERFFKTPAELDHFHSL